MRTMPNDQDPSANGVPLSKKTLKMRRYRQNVRADEKRLVAAKEKDRLRKKQDRALTRDQLKQNPRMLKIAREKKRVAQQQYREKAKRKKEEMKYIQGVEPRTRTPKSVEKKLVTEQKKKAVLTTQNWRMKIKLQDKIKSSHSTCPSPFSSRWSAYRKRKQVEKNMPATPAKKAAIIERLVASPRTHRILEEKGTILSNRVKQRLQMSDALLHSLKKLVHQRIKNMPEKPSTRLP